MLQKRFYSNDFDHIFGIMCSLFLVWNFYFNYLKNKNKIIGNSFHDGSFVLRDPRSTFVISFKCGRCMSTTSRSTYTQLMMRLCWDFYVNMLFSHSLSCFCSQYCVWCLPKKHYSLLHSENGPVLPAKLITCIVPWKLSLFCLLMKNFPVLFLFVVKFVL